eukprot:2254856-Rhodomonas_salina.3
MERAVMDHVLGKRMSWKLDERGAAEAMIAIAKFKVMANHAHEVVAARKAGAGGQRRKFVAESAHQPSRRSQACTRGARANSDDDDDDAVAVEWMKQHADEFSFFVGDDREWQDYMRKMAQPCT